MGSHEANSHRPMERLLRDKLTVALEPSYLTLENESPLHGLSLEAERHFRVVIVSETFQGLTRVARHRFIHGLVAEELRSSVHALSLQAYTPEEWEERVARAGGLPVESQSPECRGGGKRENKF